MPVDVTLIDCLPDGRLAFIYHDDLADLTREGWAVIRRVSDVEPDALGQWWADMARVNGPKLGPFVKRGDALAAEREWLQANLRPDQAA